MQISSSFSSNEVPLFVCFGKFKLKSISLDVNSNPVPNFAHPSKFFFFFQMCNLQEYLTSFFTFNAVSYVFSVTGNVRWIRKTYDDYLHINLTATTFPMLIRKQKVGLKNCIELWHFQPCSIGREQKIAVEKGRPSTSQLITGVPPVTFSAGSSESDHSGVTPVEIRWSGTWVVRLRGASRESDRRYTCIHLTSTGPAFFHRYFSHPPYWSLN